MPSASSSIPLLFAHSERKLKMIYVEMPKEAQERFLKAYDAMLKFKYPNGLTSQSERGEVARAILNFVSTFKLSNETLAQWSEDVDVAWCEARMKEEL